MHRPRLARLAAAGAFAFLASGCNDVTTPANLTPIDIALDFCASNTPVWFAFQNGGDPDWTRVLPDAEGTFRFSATRRVALAFVFQNGSDYRTEIIGIGNTELQAVSDIACLDESGLKQLNGSVAGATGSQLSQVTMSFASVYLAANQTSFSLTRLPDRALDIIASRVNISGSTTQTVDRLIIRRNQNLVNNATLSLLDFNSAEAFTPASTSVNVTGTDGESAFLYEYFVSQQATSHVLFFSQLSGDGNVVAPIIPATQTAAGDYHDLFSVATTADGAGFRGAESFFRTPPATQNLPLGPALANDPQFTTVASTPYVQLRMFLPIGTNGYDRAANFSFHQQTQFNANDWSVTVTEGFYNFNPTAWEVTMPDFTGVDGWQNAWGLQAGTAIDWTATAYFGRPALLFGASASEGEGILFAGRQSVPVTQAARAAPASTALSRRSAWRRP